MVMSRVLMQNYPLVFVLLVNATFNRHGNKFPFFTTKEKENGTEHNKNTTRSSLWSLVSQSVYREISLGERLTTDKSEMSVN